MNLLWQNLHMNSFLGLVEPLAGTETVLILGYLEVHGATKLPKGSSGMAPGNGESALVADSASLVKSNLVLNRLVSIWYRMGEDGRRHLAVSTVV